MRHEIDIDLLIYFLARKQVSVRSIIKDALSVLLYIAQCKISIAYNIFTGAIALPVSAYDIVITLGAVIPSFAKWPFAACTLSQHLWDRFNKWVESHAVSFPALLQLRWQWKQGFIHLELCRPLVDHNIPWKILSADALVQDEAKCFYGRQFFEPWQKPKCGPEQSTYALFLAWLIAGKDPFFS